MRPTAPRARGALSLHVSSAACSVGAMSAATTARDRSRDTTINVPSRPCFNDASFMASSSSIDCARFLECIAQHGTVADVIREQQNRVARSARCFARPTDRDARRSAPRRTRRASSKFGSTFRALTPPPPVHIRAHAAAHESRRCASRSTPARRNVLIRSHQIRRAANEIVAARDIAGCVAEIDVRVRAPSGRRASRSSSGTGSPATNSTNDPPSISSNQPGLPSTHNRRVGTRRTGARERRESIGIRRVQWRIVVATRRRQSPAVHQRARKRITLREPQHRVAEHAADRALRRDEVGRARRVQQVLRRAGLPFGVDTSTAAQRGASPRITRASFHTRFSTPCTAPLAPRAPNGDTWCAESPMNSTRPCTSRSSFRQRNVYALAHSRSHVRSAPSIALMRGRMFSMLQRLRRRPHRRRSENRRARRCRAADAATPNVPDETAGRTRTSARSENRRASRCRRSGTDRETPARAQLRPAIRAPDCSRRRPPAGSRMSA